MKQRPFEVEPGEYPFQSHWFERQGCSMHYLDEGSGLPIVMCHGNPTWSYMYRSLIKSLLPGHRCIAYDLPGFGFSDHPPNYGYTPQEHAEWVEALVIEHLKLERFVLVMQDWGGPIGLRLATRHPARVAGMVISNTFIGTPTRTLRWFSAIMGSPLGQWFILQKNGFATWLLSAMLNKPSTSTLQAYARPFPTAASRRGTAVFPVQLLQARTWLEDTEQQLTALSGVPVELIFGLKDPDMGPSVRNTWLNRFPQSGIQLLPDVHHYTPEDCPTSFVTAVERIVAHS